MADSKFLFENHAELMGFQQQQLLTKFPERCLGCPDIGLITLRLAAAVDRGEISADTAIEQATKKGMKTAENCRYGYSEERGCGSGVLCRMG